MPCITANYSDNDDTTIDFFVVHQDSGAIVDDYTNPTKPESGIDGFAWPVNLLKSHPRIFVGNGSGMRNLAFILLNTATVSPPKPFVAPPRSRASFHQFSPYW
jgi:hypothetical protein